MPPSKTGPAQASKRSRCLRPIPLALLGVLCLLIAVVTYAFSTRYPAPTFTNGSGTFQIQSIRISRGSRWVTYFPNCQKYLEEKALELLHRPTVPMAERIDRTTSVDRVGLWIRWTNDTGGLHPSSISIELAKEAEPAATATVGASTNVANFNPDARRQSESHGVRIGRGFDSIGSILVAVSSSKTKSGEFLYILNTNTLPDSDLVVRTLDGESTIHFQKRKQL